MAFSSRLEYSTINGGLLFEDPKPHIRKTAISHSQPQERYPIEDRSHLGYITQNSRTHLPELDGLKCVDGMMIADENLFGAAKGPDLVFERGDFQPGPSEYNFPTNTEFYSNYYNVFGDGLKKQQPQGPSEIEQREAVLLNYNKQIEQANSIPDEGLRATKRAEADNYLLLHKPELFQVISQQRNTQQIKDQLQSQKSEQLARQKLEERQLSRQRIGEQLLLDREEQLAELKELEVAEVGAEAYLSLLGNANFLLNQGELQETLDAANGSYEEVLSGFFSVDQLREVLELEFERISENISEEMRRDIREDEKEISRVAEELAVIRIGNIIPNPAEFESRLYSMYLNMSLLQDQERQAQARDIVRYEAVTILGDRLNEYDVEDVKDYINERAEELSNGNIENLAAMIEEEFTVRVVNLMDETLGDEDKDEKDQLEVSNEIEAFIEDLDLILSVRDMDIYDVRVLIADLMKSIDYNNAPLQEISEQRKAIFRLANEMSRRGNPILPASRPHFRDNQVVYDALYRELMKAYIFDFIPENRQSIIDVMREFDNVNTPKEVKAIAKRYVSAFPTYLM